MRQLCLWALPHANMCQAKVDAVFVTRLPIVKARVYGDVMDNTDFTVFLKTMCVQTARGSRHFFFFYQKMF